MNYPAVYLSKVDVSKVREQAKFVMKKDRKLKATTRLLQVRIPIDLYAGLEKKCNEYGWELDKAISNLVKEWII